jgi:periplasmic divalent cation tolerance protein
LVEDSEHVMVVKSVSEKYDEIKKRIKELHSYKIPAIIRMSVDLNKDYLNWMRGQL